MMAELAGGEWGQVAASRLVGFVDFRDASSHSEVEKRTRLSWFSKLVANVVKSSAYLAKVPRTVEAVVNWIDQQIGPSLAIAVKWFGGDMLKLRDIVDYGEQRFKPRHKRMLAAAGVG